MFVILKDLCISCHAFIANCNHGTMTCHRLKCLAVTLEIARHMMSKVASTKSSIEELLQSGAFDGLKGFPPERVLCEQLGVSRNTLRSALDLLEADGKVWRRLGSGTFAGSAPKQEPGSLLAIGQGANPFELMELRLVLEPEIAGMAALRAARGEIDYMQHCAKKCLTAANSESYELWDAALHNAVAAGTHNSVIISTLEAINQLRRITIWGTLRDRIVSDGSQSLWSSQHQAFVDAIADRDAEGAKEAARVHVAAVLAKISSVWPPT